MPTTQSTYENSGNRRCTGCRETFPASREYFYRAPGSGRLGLCLACNCAYYAMRSARRANGGTATSGAPRFGCEIEFIGNRQDVLRVLLAAGINVRIENYGHMTRSYWKIVTDASVSRGGELVSPPLRGANGLAEITRVCDAINASGVATADRTCGLHVHHEMTSHTAQSFGNVFAAWYANQAVIDTMVSTSRRGNRSPQWCRPLESRDVDHIVRQISNYGLSRRTTRFSVDRYKNLNVMSFPKYGTIEVRLHQGTTDAKKINAWIEFGQAFFAWAKTVDSTTAARPFATLADLLNALPLADATKTYLLRRAARLTSGSRADVFGEAGESVDDTAEQIREDGTCGCRVCRESSDRRARVGLDPIATGAR